MSPRKRSAAQARADVLDFAIGLPGAFVDHPWGETVVKVDKKIFAFLGSDDSAHPPTIGLKLDESHEQALQAPGAEPSGYGLGRSGWVRIPLAAAAPSVGVLTDWVEESYRLVALKRRVAELDRRAAP